MSSEFLNLCDPFSLTSLSHLPFVIATNISSPLFFHKKVVFEPEQYARKNARISEHLLFIGPGEGFLEVVGPLRLYHSKSHPVIVAVMLEEDRNLESAIKVARSFPDIFIVLGNGHDITTAFLCGVDRCSHIIIAPRATARYEEEEEDPYLVDADVVFTVR